MKVLVVCQYFYPEQFKISDICFELVKMGHEITVLTGLPNYPGGIVPREYRWLKRRREILNGVEVIRTTIVGRGQGKLKLALNYVSFALFSSIKALFLSKDFDLILVWQLSPVTMAFPGILLKKLTGKPLLLYCQDLWPESILAAGVKKGGFFYRRLLSLSRFIYKSADRIAISSKLFSKYLIEVIGYTDGVIYLPVYAESIFENIVSQNNCSDINLVFAGNIGEMQSVETIIEAANLLKDYKEIKWHIVGDGSNRANCEKIANEYGLTNMFFYGQKTLEEMPVYYSMANAFLVSLKADEIISYTLPNKVQSYMAAGKPIIGSINGETRIVIDQANCGYCCEAENHMALAAIIKKFVLHHEQHHEFGLNAQKYYKDHFDKNIFFNDLFKFFAGMCQASARCQ